MISRPSHRRLDDAPPPWGRYERLRPAAIEAILAARPIALVPWGALEFHGVHAPIGLDGLKAHGLCCAIAARTGGVVLPPVWHATSTIKTLEHLLHRQHSIEHRPDTVVALLHDLVTQLIEEQFRVVLVLSGHIGQPHQSLLEEEGRRLAQQHPAARVLIESDTRLVRAPDLVPNHAGLGEIALLLHLDPETIDLTILPADRTPDLARDAVLGPDPRSATAAAGAAIAAQLVAAAADRIESALAAVATPPRAFAP